MDRWWARLMFRVVGNPPPPGSARLDQLVWVRQFYTRPAPIWVALYVIVAVTLPRPLNWAAPVFGVVIWLWGFASFSAKIRRAREQQ